MCSSRPVANETLGSQVHFPWLPFLPCLWCRLHWAHLPTRVKHQNLISLKRIKYLCPSFTLLLLQYDNSILRIAFACGNMMNKQFEHSIEVQLLNILHRTSRKIPCCAHIHLICVQKTSLYFVHPCKILHMWHLPGQGSYTPDAHVQKTPMYPFVQGCTKSVQLAPTCLAAAVHAVLLRPTYSSSYSSPPDQKPAKQPVSL